MCRFVAYHGSETTVQPLVYGGDHPLVEQAWNPRELLVGQTNADGYGVAWYHGGQPVRIARAEPIWYDADLERLLETVRSSTVVASLRNATPGMPIGVSAVAPLVLDRWSFALNGFIEGFHPRLKREFHRSLPDELYARLRNGNDTETLFFLAVHEVQQGASAGEALRRVVDRVRGAVNTQHGDLRAQLNMVLTDGRRVAISRASTVRVTNSLYLADDPDLVGEGVVLASEALDQDSAWEPVEPQTVVEIAEDGSVDTFSVPR